MQTLLFIAIFAAGILAHRVWAALRAEPEYIHAFPDEERLDAVYEAHYDGLMRGHQMTLAGTWSVHRLDAVCGRYLVEAGAQPALAAADEPPIGI
jgi:hypothetical protein